MDHSAASAAILFEEEHEDEEDDSGEVDADHSCGNAWLNSHIVW